MTRGRKKDLTIPPTRSLTQQRDYRARKANYVNELEVHCQKLDAENSALKREVADLRARLANPVIVHPETVQASQDLLYSLTMASVSLTKFQQLAFPNVQQPHQASSSQGDHPNSHGVHASPSPDRDLHEAGVRSQTQSRNGRKRLFTESEEESLIHSPINSPGIPESPGLTRSGSSDGSCCGGYVDCDALTGAGILESSERAGSISRLSDVRSTFHS